VNLVKLVGEARPQPAPVGRAKVTDAGGTGCSSRERRTARDRTVYSLYRAAPATVAIRSSASPQAMPMTIAPAGNMPIMAKPMLG
jgi:hypothetical protein